MHIYITERVGSRRRDGNLHRVRTVLIKIRGNPNTLIKVGFWLGVCGLLLDLFGAVIVLAADWPPLYDRLVRVGKNRFWVSRLPIVGSPFRRLEFLHQLERAEEIILTGKLEDTNWPIKNQPLNRDDEGFAALRRVLVDNLDVLPQFNRVSLGVIQRGHTDRPDVANIYLNTSLLTVMEGRRKKGIEPWFLRDYIDDVPLEQAQRVVDKTKNGIVVGLGARLLIVGFILQLIAEGLPG